jgi:hypothetical protein
MTETREDTDRRLALLAVQVRDVATVERGILTDAERRLLVDAATLIDSIPYLDR